MPCNLEVWRWSGEPKKKHLKVVVVVYCLQETGVKGKEKKCLGPIKMRKGHSLAYWAYSGWKQRWVSWKSPEKTAAMLATISLWYRFHLFKHQQAGEPPPKHLFLWNLGANGIKSFPTKHRKHLQILGACVVSYTIPTTCAMIWKVSMLSAAKANLASTAQLIHETMEWVHPFRVANIFQ